MPRKAGILGMTPALEQVYYFLIEVADAGEKCPLNSEIASRLDIVEEATVSQRISALRRRGFIRVSYGHWGRQVDICGTDLRTSKARRRNGRQIGHRVDSKRNKRNLAQLTTAPVLDDPPDNEEQKIIDGLTKWARNWDADLDEVERWLACAIDAMTTDREETAA